MSAFRLLYPDYYASITYTSPRQLCALIDGLVTGVARHYGETIEIEQPLCMLRGDAAGCTFFIMRP